jgi:excisionase family DNA binding protein
VHGTGKVVNFRASSLFILTAIWRLLCQAVSMKPSRVGTLQIMTVSEVAEYLRVDKVTIYKLIREHRLPAFKIGSDWRFDKDAVEKWMALSNTQKGK